MNPNFIVAWLQKHKISTHTIGVLVTGLILYYRTNPDFHALIVDIQGHIPKWVITLGIAGFWLYTWYRNGQKPPDPSGPIVQSSVGGGGMIRGGGTGLAALFIVCMLTLSTSGCAAKYTIHPNSIPIAGDAGAFDSRTADFLADEKAFLDEAMKHTADYPQAVNELLGYAQKQYGITKASYLAWRATQTPATLSQLTADKSNLQSAITNFSNAQKAGK